MDLTLTQALAALSPQFADDARRTDTDGVSPDTVVALRQTGLFAPMLPAADRLEAARQLARACAATAWIAAQFAETADLGLQGPAAWAGRPEGVVLEDGKVSGVWKAASGLAYANWVVLSGVGPGMVAVVPRNSVQVETHPYLGGLRGVGWSQVSATGLAVPADRVVPFALDENRLAGLILGCAEGGLADYVKMTRARVSGIGGQMVAQFTQVQARLAETEADFRALALLFEGLKANPAGPDAARDRAYIARKALDGVTRLVRQMGAMGIGESNPVQRRYRDLRTLAADASVRWDDNMAAAGRRTLGIVAAQTSAA
jgi:alkylation response protein AidB-like acyl-CoA dehydrogenase